MKNIKKLLSVVLILVMVLTAAPLGGFADLDISGWFNIRANAGSYGYWFDLQYYISDNEVSIISCPQTRGGGLTLPSELEGYPVTKIESEAFAYCKNLTAIDIPDSVTTIENRAFIGCSSLSLLTIGKNVKTIGSYAFYSCSAIKTLTIPDSVMSIRANAFYGCTALSDLTIGKNVEIIGDEAFRGCTSLTNLTIPDSVTSIGQEAFTECTALTSVEIGDNVKTMKGFEFVNCTALTRAKIGSGVESIEGTFQNCSNLKTVVLSDNLKSIGERTFKNCTSLSSIDIPDSVVSIGDYAFEYCFGFTYLVIPDNVAYIGSNAFARCNNLKALIIGNGVKEIDECAFAGNILLSNVNITNPEGIEKIGANIFDATPWYEAQPDGEFYIGKVYYEYKGEMPEGTSIEIKNGTVYISPYAFGGRSELESITIPGSVKAIGVTAFSDCDNLISVTVPYGVKTIEEEAFKSCDNLAELVISDSVESIGGKAFYYCSKLVDITVGDGVKSIGYEAFYGTAWYYAQSVGPVYVGRVFYGYWGLSDNAHVVLKEGTTGITEYAFNRQDQRFEKLVGITIPKSIKRIDYGAFKLCTRLEKAYYLGTEEEWNNVDVAGLNTYLKDALIFHPTHTFGEWEIKTPASCSEEGILQRECVCKVTETETIPMLEHEYNKVTIEHTCTEDGFIEHTCTVCGYSYDDCFVAAPGHVWSDWMTWIEPTCSVEGVSQRTCSVCDDKEERAIETAPHNYCTEVVEATCSDVGYTTYTCNNCYFSYDADYVAELGHKYELEKTIPATHLNEGEKIYTCFCGDSYSKSIDKLPGHTFGKEITPPTCTKIGYTTYYCECGEKYDTDFVAAPGHKYELENTIPATHTEEGKKIYTCFCGDSYSKPIDKLLDHTFEKEITPPTCTKIGYTTYYCECGEKYEANYVAELGHKYIPEVTKEPTHLECGIETYTCDCGDSYKKEIPNIKEHSYEKMVTPPTCTEGGYTIYYCECGDRYEEATPEMGHRAFIYVAGIEPTCTEEGFTDCIACKVCETILVESETLLALGHEKVSDGYKAPTCTEDGLSELVHCSRCDYVFLGQNTIPAEHKWEIDEGASKEVTCEEDGYYLYRCSECGETYSKTEEAHGHYDNGVWEIVEKATCITEGVKKSKCKVCSVEIFETIPSLGEHIWSDWIVETQATCENEGLDVIACKDCGIINAKRITEKLPHDYKNGWQNLIEATCTENGLTIQICRNCLNIQTQTIYAKGHNVVVSEYEKVPTCTEKGRTATLICSVCEVVIKKSEVLDALGHVWEVYNKVEATCKKNGFIEKKCTRCNEKATETIEAKGHIKVIFSAVKMPTCTEFGQTEGCLCQVCNEIINKVELVEPFGHDYSEWVVTKLATCVETGEAKSTCKRCKFENVKVIDKTAHKEKSVPAVESTCVNMGHTSGIICEFCGSIIKGVESIPSYGHRFDVGGSYDKYRDSMKCLICGYTEKIKLNPELFNIHGFKLYTSGTAAFKLSWSKCAGAVGYDLLNIDENGNGYIVATDIKTCDYTVKQFSSGLFCVRAYGYVDGELVYGAWSDAIYGSVLPTTPKNIKGIIKCDSIVITWDDVVNASGYEVYMKSNGENFRSIGVSYTNSLTVTELENSSKKEFKVRAFIGDADEKLYGNFCETIILYYEEAQDHIYADWVTTREATCAWEGREEASCINCGKITYRTVQKKPHSEEVKFVEVLPTCTTNGKTAEIWCYVCGATLSASEIVPMLEHNYTYSIINDSTCTLAGSKYKICQGCKAQEIIEVPAKGHDFDGTTCKDCGYNKAEHCSCNCHKTGILAILWKLINLFNKFLKKNPICSCGKAHY